MIKIKIICIGTLKERFFKDAFNEYQKRLSAFCKFELIELDEYKIKSCPSETEIEKCLEQEGLKIFTKIPDSSYKNLPSTSKTLLQIKQVAFAL